MDIIELVVRVFRRDLNGHLVAALTHARQKPSSCPDPAAGSRSSTSRISGVAGVQSPRRGGEGELISIAPTQILARAGPIEGILRPWQIIVPRGDGPRAALHHVSRRRLVLNE